MDTALLILQYIYIPLSYSLYFLIFYIIFAPASRKQFTSSFYHIFAMQAVMGLMYNFTYSLCIRGILVPLMSPLVDIWPKEGFWCTLPLVLLYHGGCALTMLDVVISYNRLSIFTLKSKYRAFWKSAMKYILIGIIFLPMLTTWHFWITNVTASPFAEGYVWGDDNPERVPWMKSAINTAAIIFVCSLISLTNNVLTVMKLIQQRKKNDSTYIGDFDKKLFVYSLLIFVGHVVSLIIQCLFFIDVNELYSYELFYAQIFITDYVSLGPAWCILFMSADVQRQIAMLLGFYKFMGHDRVSAAATEHTMPSIIVVGQRVQSNSKRCKHHSTAY